MRCLEIAHRALLRDALRDALLGAATAYYNHSTFGVRRAGTARLLTGSCVRLRTLISLNV